MFPNRIQNVYFTAHTAEEVRKFAVKKITNPETFDMLLHPNPSGLYDTCLGPSDKLDFCDTCSLKGILCPGHFGYIELPLTVYHPIFFKLLVQILRGSCFNCHRLIPSSSQSHLFIRQCELLDHGFLTEASNLCELAGTFKEQARSSGFKDTNLEKAVMREIDMYYSEICKDNIHFHPKNSTKNVIKFRQQIIKNFLKKILLRKLRLCPHCGVIRREVKSEYNIRLYFAGVSNQAVQKALKVEHEEQIENIETQEESEFDETANFFEDPVDTYAVNKKDEDLPPTEEQLKKKLRNQEYITPDEVKKHIVQLWKNEEALLMALFGSYNSPQGKHKVTTPELFFLDLITVPPSRFRPLSYMGEKTFENPHTANLAKILWKCKLVEELLLRFNDDDNDDYVPLTLSTGRGKRNKDSVVRVQGKTNKEQLQNAWEELQSDVNTLMDNSLTKLTKEPLPGIRQLLEKKEGLFRKNMMGKRVNYACRSVISPDFNINMDEIGIPMVFASKLTYVQPVTMWNLSQLKQMVINGPKKWPGAVMVENENGRTTFLTDNEDERRGVANQLLSSSLRNQDADHGHVISMEKKVHRHLLNGDVLLLNRQPTLHRPSIMAHKARVLPGEHTLRMHYANCKSYNADFDGDEMNAHFPQSELARSEAYNLVSTSCNYLSPKDGKPLAGLFQDHVVAGVWMTSRDKFFDREDYQELMYRALIDLPCRVKTIPPCIMKPKRLWSGKQIVSSILLNVIPESRPLLNLSGNSAKVSDKNWPKQPGAHVKGVSVNDPCLMENQVIFREGELMTGILDKTQYGSVPYGLVHCVYELYGGNVSGWLLSILARLFTAYLQQTGFTLGIQDILVVADAEEKRREIIRESRHCGVESAMEALDLKSRDDLDESLQKAQFTNDGLELQMLDLSMKRRTDIFTNNINSECIRGLYRKFPDNSLQLMVQSGAKGSSVNAMQISCLLGQIELEGKRPPLTISGRALPSFGPTELSPRARGFVDGRFLTGIRPQEYFFHCMAGREGLIDTAVKTSRSGYLQRCLVKHLEALHVHYDMTVRDGDGSIVQFLYGDDGVDVLQNQFLNKDQFKTIAQNYEAFMSMLKPHVMDKHVDLERAIKHKKKCDRWKRKNGEPFSNVYTHLRSSPFHLFEKEYKQKHVTKERGQIKEGRTSYERRMIKRWFKCDETLRESYTKNCKPCPDPVLSKFNMACHFGAVSEKFQDDVHSFVKMNENNVLKEDDDDDDEDDSKKVSADTFQPLMMIKFLRSAIHPGEAVGLLASQSIGEPSTQMTLNTFHFAGQSDMNVTLGIPRLREILMTASSNIKTPQMDVLINAGLENNAKEIAKNLNKITLSQVFKRVSVFESLKKFNYDNRIRCRQFRVSFEFIPPDLYQSSCNLQPQQIMRYVEKIFFKRICAAVEKIIKNKQSQRLVNYSTISAAQTERRLQNDEEDDDVDVTDEEIGDGDASDQKQQNRKKQFSSYDDPEERMEELEEMQGNIVHIKQEPINDDEVLYETESNMDDVKPTNNSTKGKCEDGEDPRIMNVKKRNSHIMAYQYDDNNNWCEVLLQFPMFGSKILMGSLIESLAEKSVVHEALGINRGVVSESKSRSESGRFRLKTEGVNLQEMWKYPEELDLNSLYSNNIHAVANTYGIEAARCVIIKEVQSVFHFYGIQIDARHLSLVGDYMTFEGVYKPFNRVAIETNSFPFQKMSFETSTNFLRSATAFGEPDALGSPSSRLVVGRVIGTGTGLMDVLPKISL